MFISILEHLTPWRILSRRAVKYESFFVIAVYVDEATLRHVHIQGRNTTKNTLNVNLWNCHS